MSSVDETAERIYWLLTDALSDETCKRQRAEKGLRDAESQPDFFASLAMICTSSDEQAPPRVRWLAAVVGKNAMSRSWRPRLNQKSVTEEERHFVRDALLSSLAEPHATIASQVAVWIARIARIDYPTHWPSLMPTLCQALSTTNPPDGRRTTLHTLRAACELFTALASRRLTAHRKSFYSAAPPAFDAIRNLFSVYIRILMAAPNAEAARDAFEIVDLCMKCLRILLMHGYARVDNVPPIHGLFGDLLAHPDIFMRGSDGGTEVEQRLSLLAAKLVVRTFERHPIDFQIFLPQFLEVYWRMLVNYKNDTAVDEICAQAAHFLQCVLVCPDFNYSSNTIVDFRQHGNRAAADDRRGQARQIVLGFFTNARVDALIEAMFTKIFVLRETEAISWRDDPESFGQEDEAAEWGTQTLRVACDEIFKTLLVRDKRRIAPKVIALAESVPSSKPLFRDACYRAVGNAVYDLEGLFDFEPWLYGQLGPLLEANVGDNVGDRVLQSRAAWLVGQFAAQLSREARQAVYSLLVSLMARPSGDRVVALVSSGALFSLAEDMGFLAEDFIPHLGSCMEATFKLLLSSETVETKRTLLTLATQLVVKCPREAIVALLPALTAVLPLVWQSDRRAHGVYSATVGSDDRGDANMLKTALVVFLVHLLHKCGHWSVKNDKLCHFVHEAILYGTDLSSGGGAVYLAEDACELWRLFLACSTEYNPELSSMFNRIPVIIKDDPSRFKELSHVIESYALLGRESFIQSNGTVLLALLEGILQNSRDRGCLAVVEILDLILQLFPYEAVHFLRPIMEYLFESCMKDGSVSAVLSAAYAALIARAAVLNVESVERVILRGDASRVERWFRVLIQRLDIVHRRERRKLVVLALCGMTARYAKSEVIRTHIPAVLNAAVQVLAASQYKQGVTFSVGEFANAIARHGESGIVDTIANDKEEQEAVPEHERRRLLFEMDVTRSTKIGDAVKNMMNVIRAEGGEAAYQMAMQSTGEEVLKQLERFMSEESNRGKAG